MKHIIKYEVGDKVVIRRDLEEGKMYEDRYVFDDMLQFAGKEAKIMRSDGDGDYSIDLDSDEFYWTAEMFEEPTSNTPTIEIPNLPKSQTLLNLNAKVIIDEQSLKEVEEQIKLLQDKLNNLKLKLVF